MKKLYVINHVKTTSLHQHPKANSDELTALRKITPVVGEDGEADASFSPGWVQWVHTLTWQPHF